MAVAEKQLVATCAFVARVGKTDRIVQEGEKVKATDPVVKGREALFKAT